MPSRLFPVFGLNLLLLSACATTSSPPAASPDSGQIQGSAFYLERIALPPDVVLDVRLVNTRLADTPLAVVAQQRFEHLQGPPYRFTLNYDPAKLQANMSYSLSATLRGADGHLWFVTDTSVPVIPGKTDIVEFRLIRVSSNSP